LSPILKVTSALQFGPWKFQKLQSSPFSSTSGQLLCSAPSACCRAAHRSGPPPQRHLLPASCSTRRAAPPRRSTPRAGALNPSPRAPAELSGRHLAVAVASSLQSPGPRFLARSRTKSTPESFSTRLFAYSPLPRSRTRRRSTPNAGELKPPSTRLTAAPPPALTPQLAPLEPRTSPWPLLVAYRPPKPLAVELRRRAELRRPLLTVERIAPDLLRSIQPLH